MAGERNARDVQNLEARLWNHVLPFVGSKGISEITPALLQEHRSQRQTPNADGEVPAHNTLNQDIIVLPKVMKTALRHG
ncbi:MAG: hypothetical protein AAFX39_10540 [Pseudomonadota bacterium]